MLSLDSGVYTLPSPTNYSSKDLPSQAGKRLFDLVITFLLLVFFLAWAVPLIAMMIRLTSRGPVFLIQLRTGKHGRPYRYFRFRTTPCIAQKGLSTTSYPPAQVTALGRFLRATHLDELPLFFNVLLGDMSIVGPRPHTLQYDAQHWTLPGYRDRYRMRPGIIGLSQIRARRVKLQQPDSVHNGIRYDRWYLSQYSLGLDLKICWWKISRPYPIAHN
ncbi:sugar transferase [Larkinella insperata]|uniref:Sugar transferase n=1 Tax=Larkinella insperata TaxID=332158 RepID=A0ABW3QAP4_9BACT|nr:sugar transferase [Larkinella insperata]